MSLPREALEALDAIGQHPALVELAGQAPPGIDVAAVARSMARRLVGYPLASEDEDPLAQLFFAIAAAELALLSTACHGEPLKAILATVALLRALIPRYPAEPPPAQKSGEPPSSDMGDMGDTAGTQGEGALPASPSPPGDPPEPETRDPRARLRMLLEMLSQRRLPDTFPLPSATVTSPDPVRLGASLADQMGVEQAASAAFAELDAHDSALNALSRLLPGFGWDFGTGALTQALLKDLTAFAELVAKLPVLARICDQLGRMEGNARKRTSSQRGGRAEVVGVRVGGELADVLPSELALLSELHTEDLFYQRFIDRRLMCLELQGVAAERNSDGDRRGPIIACVDTSGSMEGAPEIVAKALILAVVRKARAQRRAVRLLLFSGPGEIVDQELRPDRGGLRVVLDFLAMSFRSGTDFDGPLRRAIALLQEELFVQADILVVTDGLGAASRELCEEVRAARREHGVRVLSVVVGGQPHGVREFSDDVWLIDPSKPGKPGGSDELGGIDLYTWKREQTSRME